MRNDKLDWVKSGCAILIIFIHVNFPGKLGYVMDSLARIGVPLFFIVSGYYCVVNDENCLAKIRKKIHRMCILLLSLTVIYIIFFATFFIQPIERVLTSKSAWGSELYVSSIISAIALFVICIYPTHIGVHFVIEIQKFPEFCYFFHPMIGAVLYSKLFNENGKIVNYFIPIVSCTIMIILYIVWDTSYRTIKKIDKGREYEDISILFTTVS